MRPAILLSVVLSFVASAAHAQSSGPMPVFAEYSDIYDSYKHRKHLPDCPSEAEAAPRIWHALDLWERQGDRVMSEIRKVAEMSGFPRLPITVYIIACGRSISSPATVAVYKGGPKGPFVPLTDEELLTDIAHELLHTVAQTPKFSDMHYMLVTAYPDEPSTVRSHMILAALETRLVGYEVVRRRYAGNPEYARALELARKFGIVSQQPWDR